MVEFPPRDGAALRRKGAMKPLDFIATAKVLVNAKGGVRPRETNLRRAVSTAYYALFHCLAECCANMIVGGTGANRSQPAWNQAYRALEHGLARNRCADQERVRRFPHDIQDFAKQFVHIQKRRHSADYDPDPPGFNKSDVVQDIRDAEDVIRRFARVSAKDRRAFAVYVLLRSRGV